MINTPKYLHNLTIQGIDLFHSGKESLDISSLRKNKINAALHKNTIDWDNFTSGRTSKEY